MAFNAGSLFGGASGFGSTTNQPSNMFGSTTNPTSAFGNTTTAPAQSTQAPSMFGQTQTQTPQPAQSTTLGQPQPQQATSVQAPGQASTQGTQPAFFNSLLERGKKRPLSSTVQSGNFEDVPSLQLGLDDIRRKARELGKSGKDSLQNGTATKA